LVNRFYIFKRVCCIRTSVCCVCMVEMKVESRNIEHRVELLELETREQTVQCTEVRVGRTTRGTVLF